MKIIKDIKTGENQVKLENGTIINRYSHVVAGAEIGSDSMIGQGCYIAGDAKIGNRVRIQNGNNIWNGVEIGDNVFIAPVVALTNDHDPSTRNERGSREPDKTIICDNSTICSNSTIIAPVVIGKGAKIAAGTIVLKSVPANMMVKGIWK